MSITISALQFVQFEAEYFSDDKQQLRYGQAFLNKFAPEGYSCPELYYETNSGKAKNFIIANYYDPDMED